MKIKDADFQKLRAALEPVLDEHGRSSWKLYKEKGLTPTRFRWDVLHHSKYSTVHLYSYLDDSHIDTALKAICAPYMKD